MKQILDKVYNPGANEDKIYEKWEKSGFFNPDNLNLSKDAKTYTIVLPPPNITDHLHMGHTVMVAAEDLLIRYHRLLGFRTLWIPGTDHAAIATQNVVEKKLLREQGKTRHDLGREKFLDEVQKFLDVTQGEILYQIRKLGASLDWSRLAFTLDEPRQAAVRRMFKDMYEAGVIYRGERIVNWCPRCHSTLADDEVEYKEQVTKLYTFKYDHNFPISISTTRPETKLGDTAVAVNPKDERYKKYIGQEYEVNFCGQALKIKIISDRNVEADFGTGALGVTPAHSLVDWQMAQTNDLPIIKVINEDGKIHPGFGKFSGLTVLETRSAIIEDLKHHDLLEKEEDLTNNLSVCYRCGTAIEPLSSKQWFIAVDKELARLGGQSLKAKAIEVATNQAIKFYPERFKKRYCDWMDNLHDWCISRQIWFGHQIPVWYRGEEVYVGTVPPTGLDWQQDSDTLDTWFSSGMWTFSTLGWPDNFKDGVKSGDLAAFHPTQMLETGYEIITLWVSRMIMMSLFALGEIPFSQVYLHGMILDQNGKKMSKSKGNGVNPLDVIASFGADAARLSILMDATPGNDSRFNDAKVEAKRNFINKFWNISRFILSDVPDKLLSEPANKLPEAKTLADKWVLAELQKLINSTTEHLDNLELALAAEGLYDFTWNKLADWYLEIAKTEKNKEEILLYILRNLLILWHPFIPYVTETIWASFNDSLLMVARWPRATEPVELNDDLIFIQDIIVAIRNARSLNKIEPSRKLTALIYGHSRTDLLISQQLLLLNLKTGLSSLDIKEQGAAPDRAVAVITGGVEIYLLGAVDAVKEKKRLQSEQEKLEKLINSQTQKLANADFISRAPAPIVAVEKDKLTNYTKELDKIIQLSKNL